MSASASASELPEEFMPGEPTRVHHSGGRLGTAYGKIASPAKAERHYRTQKLRFLRMLGHATFRNGSQFAILWVSPTAQTAEVFGSEALQPKLDEWLGPRVRRQAIACARQLNQRKADRDTTTPRASIGRSEIFRQDGEVIDPYLDVDDQLEAEEADEVVDIQAEACEERQMAQSRSVAAELEASEAAESAQLDQSDKTASRARATCHSDAEPASLEAPLAKAEPSTSIPATPMPPTAAKDGAATAASTSTASSPELVERSASTSSLVSASTSASAGRPVQSGLVDRELTSAELEEWYSSRFDQLEYKVEKLVCRVWIKAIAPGKHKKFPYQDGDASKPEWWPADLRHKEPDHITKPERLQLLVHLIRRGPGTILALEAATAANSALIPSEKTAILASIYDVARQERKPRLAGPDLTPRTFCVSVPAESCGTLGADVAIRRKKRPVSAPAAHSSGRSRRKRSRLEDTSSAASETPESDRKTTRDSDTTRDVDDLSEAPATARADQTNPASRAENSEHSTALPHPSTAPAGAQRSTSSGEAEETMTCASGRPKRKMVAPTRFAASAHSVGPKRARRPKFSQAESVSSRAVEAEEGGIELSNLSSNSAVADDTAFKETRSSACPDMALDSSTDLPSPPPTADATRPRQPLTGAEHMKLAGYSAAFSAAPPVRESTSSLRSPPLTGDSTRGPHPWAVPGRFVRSASPASGVTSAPPPSTGSTSLSILSSSFDFSVGSCSSISRHDVFDRATRSDSSWTDLSTSSRHLDQSTTSRNRDSAPRPMYPVERTSRRTQAPYTPFDGFSHDVHAFTTSDMYTLPHDNRHSAQLTMTYNDVSTSGVPGFRDPYLMTPPGSGGDPYSTGSSRPALVPSEEDWSAAFARQLDAAILAVGAVETGAAGTFGSGDDLHDNELVSNETTDCRNSAANLLLRNEHTDVHTAFFVPQLSTFSPILTHSTERRASPTMRSADSLDGFV